MKKLDGNLPASKNDVKAVNNELKKTEKNLRAEMLRVEEKLDYRIDDVERKLDEKFDKVMTTLDGIAKGLEDLRLENSLGAEQYRDHEQRISKIESAPQ
jgi:hypothetical protein